MHKCLKRVNFRQVQSYASIAPFTYSAGSVGWHHGIGCQPPAFSSGFHIMLQKSKDTKPMQSSSMSKLNLLRSRSSTHTHTKRYYTDTQIHTRTHTHMQTQTHTHTHTRHTHTIYLHNHVINNRGCLRAAQYFCSIVRYRVTLVARLAVRLLPPPPPLPPHLPPPAFILALSLSCFDPPIVALPPLPPPPPPLAFQGSPHTLQWDKVGGGGGRRKRWTFWGPSYSNPYRYL